MERFPSSTIPFYEIIYSEFGICVKMIRICEVKSQEEIEITRNLLLEYGRIRNFDEALGDLEAESLYKLFGFIEIEAYRYNPTKGVKFFELSFK